MKRLEEGQFQSTFSDNEFLHGAICIRFNKKIELDLRVKNLESYTSGFATIAEQAATNNVYSHVKGCFPDDSFEKLSSHIM